MDVMLSLDDVEEPSCLSEGVEGGLVFATIGDGPAEESLMKISPSILESMLSLLRKGFLGG